MTLQQQQQLNWKPLPKVPRLELLMRMSASQELLVIEGERSPDLVVSWVPCYPE
jgi:hypothetical protein